jgi:hypothetical protein
LNAKKRKKSGREFFPEQIPGLIRQVRETETDMVKIRMKPLAAPDGLRLQENLPESRFAGKKEAEPEPAVSAKRDFA